nr:ribosome maturation factor RimM [Maliibacterium massiliense]
MRKLAQHLVIGQVLKPQGVRGELKIKPITDDPLRFEGMDHVYLEQQGQMVCKRCHTVRVHDGFAYLRIEGVFDRDRAEQLRGALLYVDRAHAAPLATGRYYIVDLIGCAVVNAQGEALGTLREVIQTGANDVYVIDGEKGHFMLPALKSVLLAVDIDQGVITVDESALLEVDAGAY